MGIPRLMHHLQQYAEKIIFQKHDGTGPIDEHEINAIIDGPALAYHIYYICLSKRSGAHNAYDALPSYIELGRAVVSWLEQIEQYGIRIQAILFDGLLPESKKPVRLSRLQNYANQLVNFKATYRDDLPPRSPYVPIRAKDLLAPSGPLRSKSLSASPFMVSVVIEALLSSKYAARTSVVPGEADAYCAQAARHNDAAIFTSDSDLLVHDLGPDGKVVLFRDLDVVHLASKGKCLKASRYHPNGIAARLGLPNLVKPAYFMNDDPHRSFTEVIRLAKTQNLTNLEHTEFQELYGALPVHSPFANLAVESPTSRILSGLDPRTSELIHQLRLTAQTEEVSTEDRVLPMYLPFIIDDPTKTSAWRAGEQIRQIGFSMLRAIDPSIVLIEEFERKGTRIASTQVQTFGPEDATSLGRQLQERLQQSSARYSALSPAISWRCFAAEYFLEWSNNNGKPLPTQFEMKALVLDPLSAPLTWRAIHASAHMQSILYSLRIVQQLLSFSITWLQQSGTGILSVESIQMLCSSLQRLPGLADLLEGVFDTIAPDDALRLVTDLVSGFYTSEDGSEDVKRRKKKRKTKATPSQTERTTTGWQQGNVFAALT